jgi:hypothetical protein
MFWADLGPLRGALSSEAFRRSGSLPFRKVRLWEGAHLHNVADLSIETKKQKK